MDDKAPLLREAQLHGTTSINNVDTAVRENGVQNVEADVSNTTDGNDVVPYVYICVSTYVTVYLHTATCIYFSRSIIKNYNNQVDVFCHLNTKRWL